jgi:hypothetical protein
MFLYVCKHLIGARAVEEHEQPDCHDNIKVFADVVAFQVGKAGAYGEFFVDGNLANAPNCRCARIERRDRTSASRSLYREIAHAATQVEDAAVQKGKRHFLERVEAKFPVPHLPLELLVEKLDAAIHRYSGFPQKVAATPSVATAIMRHGQSSVHRAGAIHLAKTGIGSNAANVPGFSPIGIIARHGPARYGTTSAPEGPERNLQKRTCNHK